MRRVRPSSEIERIDADRAVADDPRGHRDRPAAGEHGQAPEEAAVLVGEEVPAPVDERMERLLARDGRPAAPGQQAEPVAQPQAMSSGDMADTRAAASSIASGMPSSRWQISTTEATLDSRSVNAGSADVARSVNSRTASAGGRLVESAAVSPASPDRRA